MDQLTADAIPFPSLAMCWPSCRRDVPAPEDWPERRDRGHRWIAVLRAPAAWSRQERRLPRLNPPSAAAPPACPPAQRPWPEPADQSSGHADAKAAGEQLVDNEMSFIRQGFPEAEHSIGLFVVLPCTDRRQQGFHPPVQGCSALIEGRSVASSWIRSLTAGHSRLIVSAESPTWPWQSAINHSGSPPRSRRMSRSRLPVISLRRRLPSISCRAQAASAA